MNIFLDLDDTLADFRGHCYSHFGVDPDTCRGKGEWDFYLKWDKLNTQESFWGEIATIDTFWSDIPALPWFYELIRLAREHDRLFNILTAPTNHDNCYAGKRKWIDNHFNFDPRERLHLRKDKWRFATMGEDCVLIDDKPQNICEWNSAGGLGILFPATWNENSMYLENPVSYVRMQLDAYTFAKKVVERRLSI